jgi:hypothetical protein
MNAAGKQEALAESGPQSALLQKK